MGIPLRISKNLLPVQQSLTRLIPFAPYFSKVPQVQDPQQIFHNHSFLKEQGYDHAQRYVQIVLLLSTAKVDPRFCDRGCTEQHIGDIGTEH